MNTYTIADIRALNPCYDPAKYLREGWSGTIVDGLRHDDIPADDRLWVAFRLLDDHTNRTFAIWCARRALSLVDNPDPRSINACDVAERFFNGQASKEQIAAAADAAADAAARDADAAAWDAARDAAGAAAWAAAWAAVAAAWTAARAAWAAAWAADAAAWDAARAARDARDAAGAVAQTAWTAADAAAWDAARQEQINKLIELIEGDPMAKMQRNKGARVERLIVDMHRDAGIPCEKVSRSGYTGEDLIIADEFRGEVKSRKEALKTIQGWIKDCDILIVKPDREQPMVVLPWKTYVALIKR